MDKFPRLAGRTYWSAAQIRAELQQALSAQDSELAEQLAAMLISYQTGLRGTGGAGQTEVRS